MYTQHYRKYMIKINHVYNEAKSYIKENTMKDCLYRQWKTHPRTPLGDLAKREFSVYSKYTFSNLNLSPCRGVLTFKYYL